MSTTRTALRLIQGGAARAYAVTCGECGERLVAADRIGDQEAGTILRHLRRVHDRFLFGAPLLGDLLRHVVVEYRRPARRRVREHPARVMPAGSRPGQDISL
jgi:hypothetical protein